MEGFEQKSTWSGRHSQDGGVSRAAEISSQNHIYFLKYNKDNSS